MENRMKEKAMQGSRILGLLLSVIFLSLAGGTAADAESVKLKPGAYATSRAGCAVLAAQDPEGRFDTDDIVGGSIQDTDANFMVIDRATVGSADFECRIGKAARKGKSTRWPLACEGESSGGRVSAMRSAKTGVVSFEGGLKDWGTVYFCR